jgi:hypothetical protein
MSALFRWHAALCLVVLLPSAPCAAGQAREPEIGYVYPAGGRRGATFEITVGGQALDGVSQVRISGNGARAEVLEHKKPLTQKQINELGMKLKELQDRKREAIRKGMEEGKGAGLESFKTFAKELGLEEMDVMAFMELRKKLQDPKRQPNPQIAETVTVRVTVSQDAEFGERELRVRTPSGSSNPLFFHVGPYAEYNEKEPNDKTPDAGFRDPLPVTFNGQIMPGDVDRFRFKAPKGAHLVVSVAARELIPYLADAVPGWFQATLAILDAKGNQVAYQDDFRFRPDPVVYYEVPEDGEYVLEIRDAIYRGREDFVYRVTLGEVPFITSVFPLGGEYGVPLTVALDGWNLPARELKVEKSGDSVDVHAVPESPGIRHVSVNKGSRISNRVPLAFDTLPERSETEPNDSQNAAQAVQLPLIVNGRIDRPGDWDVFRFEGRAGDEVVAEVFARRLDSPLDSILKLTDANGTPLAVNDDCEDKRAGLTTHHADSRLGLRLPADGAFLVHLGDTQGKGGPTYAYRLRLAPARPDFELRVVPSRVNAPAGATVPITVHALRKDGFAGEVTLALKKAPEGFALSGGWIPAGRDDIRLTLTVPPQASREALELALEGCAAIEGREVRRPALPAEDMMQAFIYHHLVPMKDWKVEVTGSRRGSPLVKLLEQGPVKLVAGGTARVRFSPPGGPPVKDLRLELDEPPEGIAVQGVSVEAEGVAVRLTADAAKVKPGLKGNLIFKASTEVTWPTKDGKPGTPRVVPLGLLPAVPFEVTAAP